MAVRLLIDLTKQPKASLADVEETKFTKAFNPADRGKCTKDDIRLSIPRPAANKNWQRADPNVEGGRTSRACRAVLSRKTVDRRIRPQQVAKLCVRAKRNRARG